MANSRPELIDLRSAIFNRPARLAAATAYALSASSAPLCRHGKGRPSNRHSRRYLMADIDATPAELDERIAILEDNLRDLTEQAAAYSGAADEDRSSDRIAEIEQQL